MCLRNSLLIDEFFTLTDFLSILFMIVFSYMVELSIFSDCDIKMHENTTQLCLNQLRIL